MTDKDPVTFNALVNRSGQITIPKPVRNYLDLEVGGTAVVTVEPSD